MSEIGRVASGARRGEDLMAKVAQNVVLSPSRDIPFNKLVLSQSNVRRIKAGVSVEELAEDIARRGLLHLLPRRSERPWPMQSDRLTALAVPGGRLWRRSLPIRGSISPNFAELLLMSVQRQRQANSSMASIKLIHRWRLLRPLHGTRKRRLVRRLARN